MHQNQAKLLAIVRAQEYIENLQIEDKTTTIDTDRRMTLVPLKYGNIRT